MTIKDRLVAFAFVVLFSCWSLYALSDPAGTDAELHQLVGQWVAKNRSMGGIGSMWEFRSDGTLSMAPGAIVDEPYRVEGDKLITSPNETGPDAKPQVMRFQITGDTMRQRIESAPGLKEAGRKDKPTGEMELHRVGTATPGVPPIIGTWKPVTTSTPAAPPEMSPEARRAMEAMVKNATYTYTTAGVLKLRIAFLWMNGSYDLAKHTFTFTDQRTHKVHGGQFHLRDGRLYLTEPNGKTTDEYLRDDVN